MAKKTKETFQPDSLFWSDTYGDRSLHLSMYSEPVPFARIRHNGNRVEIENLAELARSSMPREVYAVEVSNNYITLFAINNGTLSEPNANGTRDAFIDALYEGAKRGKNPDSSSNERRNGNQPARMRIHRSLHGTQRRFTPRGE